MTYKDYMEKKCTFREYHAQFVNERIKQIVRTRIGVNRIKKSEDEHFNDIPLSMWDNIIGFNGNCPSYDLGLSKKIKEAGDWASAATLTCIMKEAARQIKESLRIVKVDYSNGNSITTEMAAHLTDEEIQEYFQPGKVFNIGSGENDLSASVVSCTILE